MTRLSTAIVCALFVVCGLLNSSCGYALAGRGTFLPATIRTIGIPTFTNRTTVFNLETTLTQKVRSEFIGRGKYDIVPDANNVDALLTGEVTAVTITPSSYNATQLASRYAVVMTARVELKDMRANMVLWDNPSLVFRQEYDAAGGQQQTDAAAFFGQDTQALDRMSAEFASSIVSAILEAF